MTNDHAEDHHQSPITITLTTTIIPIMVTIIVTIIITLTTTIIPIMAPSWSRSKPGEECGHPGEPANGTLLSSEAMFYPGEQVSYTCKQVA